MIDPIFYDASGRRRRVAAATLAVLALALAVLVWWTATMVWAQGTHAPLRFAGEAAAPRAVAVAASPMTNAAWLPRATGASGSPGRMGFYMPWDDASRASLAAHVGELDWLVPGLATVTGPDHRITYEHDAGLAVLLAGRATAPRVLPMVQNAMTDGRWDGEGVARLLASAPARARFAARLTAMVAGERGAGVMLDLESLPAGAHRDYRLFLRELRARFAPRGWAVMLAAPVGDPAWDLRAYAAVADKVVLMAYDEHWMGGEAGPIASQGWFAQVVAGAVARTGAGKAIVAIGNYAYDWDGRTTTPLTVEAGWRLAAQAGTVPVFDGPSGNPHFAYARDGRTHQVWMLDATTAWNQRRAIERTGAAGIAVWRLGSEDARLWDALAPATHDRPDLSVTPALAGVGVTGAGEILRLDGHAAAGSRAVEYDRDGLIRAVRTGRLASGDLVQRTGARRRSIALTFDDGPDPTWTPQILDVLKRERATATFFVTGTNALGQRALLNRIVDEGSELGNHSTSHADLGREPAMLVRLELGATQRLVEAYTGRAMRLFRPPYLGDADPGTHDELHAAQVAADMGYLTVGLNVDPLDWQAPGVDAIVANTIRQIEAGTAARPAQIVLLHDAGGDRSQTVAALPRIIRGLRARGYDFVGVSALAGLPRDAVMPRLDAGAAVAAARSRGLFAGVSGLRDTLGVVFVAVIVLGMARSLALTVLAWRHRRDAPPVAAPHLVPRFVSVLIPAFNEARVIEASVRRILHSRDVHLEVIVIDDGSTDDTSAVVRAAFGIDPRVMLMTLANGGKAAALNAALKVARGDLIVALDADTQFEPETIALLARWFADPAIGAVAGNAKIGNAVNWITRWQAVEYVTAQNLERRALAALDAVTVVPGAVGAWRRTALDAVGGYPEDTLAEDQDLTIAIQRAGWRIACDTEAVAWTEAPETARALFRQRYRWAYGTLQCLWKHRAVVLRGGGLGRIGLPQAILFQFVLAAVSPLVDLALVGAVIGTGWRVARDGWSATGGDTATVLAFWAAFTAVDLGCGWAAFRLDAREGRFPAIRLLTMRFGYRQLLYAVVVRAIAAAVTGPRVGWGKLERSGRVTTPAMAPVMADAIVVSMPVPVTGRVPFRRAA